MIRDKTILIVGASSGIGRAVALSLSQHSNRIVICARTKPALEQLATQITANGSQVLVCQGDALEAEHAQQIVSRAASMFGTIDIALINVGAGPALRMVDATVESINHTTALNYQSLVNFIVPLIALFKTQRHGVIAHTNSLAGLIGLPQQGPYCAAKSAAKLLIAAGSS